MCSTGGVLPQSLALADGYHMWFTGQTKGERSSIGYATSPDGKTWKPMSDKPVLAPDKPWEKVALPHRTLSTCCACDHDLR
jgi:hypothetical protein